MRRWTLVFAIAAASGCADVLGLGDYGDQDASTFDATKEAATDAGTDVSNDVTSDVTSDADADASCASAIADETTGIFVTPSGSTDTSTCGSKTVPCASIQVGLLRAHLITGKSVVYVARGTYAEALGLYAGIRLEGGWDVLDTGQTKTWVQACSDPSAAVVIHPTVQAHTVEAIDLGGTATLSTLTLQSKAASAGESLYGVFATGSSTTVALEGVLIDVGVGGNGATGSAGTTGDAGATGCLPSTGDAGTPGEYGSGAEAGVFASTGFVTSNGTTGFVGTAGLAGTNGFDGPCLACGTCKNFLGCSFNTNGVQSCGGHGFTGCGGGPGTAGGGGSGGGSSVGIFAWDAVVTVSQGRIGVAGGGAGGNGGGGGAGGAGGPGAIGEAGAPCGVSCNGSCNPNNAGGAGGDAGGTGGAGGVGGSGGGGSGGCAFGIYQGGDASVTATAATIVHGDAGAGGGPDGAAGAPGFAADRFP